MSRLIFDLNAPFCSWTEIFFPKTNCMVYLLKMMLLSFFGVNLHLLVLASRYIGLAREITAEARHVVEVSLHTHALDFYDLLLVKPPQPSL